MKKIFTLIAMAVVAMSANAQTNATATWSLAENNNGVLSPASAGTATAVTVGEGLQILEARYTWNAITFLQLQPTSSDKGTNKYASCSEMQKYADFKFTSSVDFTVKNVSLDIVKRGTGDPNVYLAVIDNAGTQTLIASGDASKEASATVIRKNTDDDGTSINQSFEANATVAAGNSFTFRVYIGKCANNKQVGIANVVISGTIPGTDGIQAIKAADAVNAPAYNLAGQKVSESYKGVVIQNGKKLIQK